VTGATGGEQEGTWATLRRRKVGQWGIAYVAGAWGLLQGLQYVSGLLNWPYRSQKLAGLALLVGNVDMAGVIRQPNLYGKRGLSWLKATPDLAPAPEVMKTQRFANVLLYRAFFTESRLANVRRMMEQYQRISELIRARQVELGLTP
jgi:hypothetical protein